MFKFLGLLFVFGFLGFLIFGVFLGRIIRFFGGGQQKKTTTRKRKTNNGNSQPNPSAKKFSKSEGEYVNFEEIKEEE